MDQYKAIKEFPGVDKGTVFTKGERGWYNGTGSRQNPVLIAAYDIENMKEYFEPILPVLYTEEDMFRFAFEVSGGGNDIELRECLKTWITKNK